MSETVIALLEQFRGLSASDRAEFLSAALKPRGNYGEWTENDAALVAAQSFAEIDAEEADGQDGTNSK